MFLKIDSGLGCTAAARCLKLNLASSGGYSICPLCFTVRPPDRWKERRGGGRPIAVLDTPPRTLLKYLKEIRIQ